MSRRACGGWQWERKGPHEAWVTKKRGARTVARRTFMPNTRRGAGEGEVKPRQEDRLSKHFGARFDEYLMSSPQRWWLCCRLLLLTRHLLLNEGLHPGTAGWMRPKTTSGVGEGRRERERERKQEKGRENVPDELASALVLPAVADVVFVVERGLAPRCTAGRKAPYHPQRCWERKGEGGMEREGVKNTGEGREKNGSHSYLMSSPLRLCCRPLFRPWCSMLLKEPHPSTAGRKTTEIQCWGGWMRARRREPHRGRGLSARARAQGCLLSPRPPARLHPPGGGLHIKMRVRVIW